MSVREWVSLFEDPNSSPRSSKLLAQGREYSPATLIEYRSKIRAHILSDTALMRGSMESTTVLDLEAYFARLARKLGGPCRTLQGVYAILRMIWRSYGQTHPDFRDPFESMSKLTYTKTRRGALTEAEIVKLFTRKGVFESELERVVLSLAFLSGLRRGEIFALRWEDIDLESRTIQVRRAVKAFESREREIGAPKWNHEREAPLSDVALDAILALEQKQGRFTT